MASRPIAAGLICLAAGGVLTACGAAEPSSPTATSGSPAPPTAPPTVAPEDQPGGAGDEQPIQVPATFELLPSGDVRPTEVAVPAFLTVRLTGVSRDGRAHTIVFEQTTIEVPAGGRASAVIEGMEKGRYPVTIDGRENAATIVSGAEPGP